MHTVSREIGEMLEAVQKWLPLYASGAIAPYYYPKLRDNVYHRTLFIAKGYSALISNSVGSHTQETVNILIHDAGAVHALEAEFADYAALCRPLVQIFNLQSAGQFWEKLEEFEEAPGNLIAMHSALSRFTMPEAVAASMAARTGNKWVLHSQKIAAQHFAQSIACGFSVTEILRLPNLEQVKGGKVIVPMCDLFGQPELRYTPKEWKAHLENVLEQLRKHPNYRVIVSEQTPDDVILWAKEDIGAIMLRAMPPTTVFGISEQRMTATFFEHLQRLTNRIPPTEKTRKQLTSYLQAL